MLEVNPAYWMGSRRMLDRHLFEPALRPSAAGDRAIFRQPIPPHPCRYSLVAKALEARFSLQSSQLNN